MADDAVELKVASPEPATVLKSVSTNPDDYGVTPEELFILTHRPKIYWYDGFRLCGCPCACLLDFIQAIFGTIGLCCGCFPYVACLTILPCLHYMLCCNACCPVLNEEAIPKDPLKTDHKEVPCRCSRRYFGSWRIALTKTPSHQRGCCWRCWRKSLDCYFLMDIIICNTPNPLGYARDGYNDFGEIVPYGPTNMYVVNVNDAIDLTVDGRMGKRDTDTPSQFYAAAPLIKAWAVYSKLHPTQYQSGSSMYTQCRKLIFTWVQDANARVMENSAETRAKMKELCDAQKGNNKEAIYKAVIAINFYLMFGGEPQPQELQALYDFTAQPAWWALEDWVNTLWLGGRVRKITQEILFLMTQMFMRFPHVIQRVVKYADEQGLPRIPAVYAMPANYIGNTLFSVPLAVNNVVEFIRADEGKYLDLFNENPQKFFLEHLRLYSSINMSTYGIRQGKEWVPPASGCPFKAQGGDRLGAFFPLINGTNSAFGSKSESLNFNPRRSDEEFGEAMIFNGIEKAFGDPTPETYPQRGCPGRAISLYCGTFVLEHFVNKK